MSKRDADEQIHKDSPGEDNGNGSWGASSGPQKATAAQLAKRRYVRFSLLPVPPSRLRDEHSPKNTSGPLLTLRPTALNFLSYTSSFRFSPMRDSRMLYIQASSLLPTCKLHCFLYKNFYQTPHLQALSSSFIIASNLQAQSLLHEKFCHQVFSVQVLSSRKTQLSITPMSTTPSILHTQPLSITPEPVTPIR